MSAEDGFNRGESGSIPCSGCQIKFRFSAAFLEGGRGVDDPWNGGKDGKTEAKQEQLTAMRHKWASCDWLML